MWAVTRAITIIITFFILVGDRTISVFSFLAHLLHILFRKIKQISPPTKKIHRKRNTDTFVLSKKLKYFAIGVLFSFVFACLPLAVIALMHNLPDPTMLSIQEVPQTTKIFDRHHTLLYEIYANQNRTVVQLADIPQYLQKATIAIEDKNFYSNPGFDIVAILRAFFKNAKGHSVQGGSTITQQLVKTALLTPDQTIQRKLEEVILSFWTERLYNKKQILQMYLNRVAYGGTAWGVEAATQTYFGKDVKDLDLAECAFLAGMPQAPSDYSPFGQNPTLWKQRQIDVLTQMQKLGLITQEQKQSAQNEHLVFQTPQTPLSAPHFVMYIRDVLIKKYGLSLVEKGGLSVTTTLDLPLQNMAQKIVSDEVNHDEYLNLTNGAAMITNPQTGDILAMVGSHDYNDPHGGTVNITTALRQPGSSIKIVTYAAALLHGYTAASTIDDSPVVYTSPWGSVYAPVNYDGRWHSSVTLRTAFANSLNIPAVKTLNAIGIPTFVTLGRQMGMSSLLDAKNYGLSLTLGSADITMLDLATTYATVANSGKRVDINPLLLVTDNKGTILEQKGYPTGVQVVDPAVTFILSNILSDNAARSMEFGANSPLYIPGHTVSVKTGTTDNKRDNWTIGYTTTTNPTPYLVAVWVGNNDNTPMSQDLASGITGAAPIWHALMLQLLQGKPDIPLPQPTNIVTKPCFGHEEYFVKGTEENVFCGLSGVSTIPISQPPAGIHIDSKNSGSQIHIQL